MPERAADIVREFHDTFGLPTRSTPALVAAPLTQPRQRLLDEEDGKVLKSELYRAPDVAGVLAAQREVADV